MPGLQIDACTHHLDWLSIFLLPVLVPILPSSFFSVVLKDTLFLFLKCNERKAIFLCYENPCNSFFFVIIPSDDASHLRHQRKGVGTIPVGWVQSGAIHHFPENFLDSANLLKRNLIPCVPPDCESDFRGGDVLFRCAEWLRTAGVKLRTSGVKHREGNTKAAWEQSFNLGNECLPIKLKCLN